jgi:hypothetical protein
MITKTRRFIGDALSALYPKSIFTCFDTVDSIVIDCEIDKSLVEAKVKELEAEYEVQEAIKKQKTEGKLYPSTEHIVSFTKDDAMGMLQVKAAFELGLPETIIEFSNGTKFPIVPQDFPAFAKWFVIERNNFFKG